ncbi:MAG: hypothetical protein GX964_06115 [Syntrophomonadaceae bacterium]|jgi:uncharacterized protein (DUF4213/DUF364 family)|nr:hypothetical protein [Syntrophomonadaceae bacterium]
MFKEIIEFLRANVFAMPSVDSIVFHSRYIGAYLSSREAGLAVNPLTTELSDENISYLQDIIGQNAVQAAEVLCASGVPWKFATGIAILNALSQPYLTFKYLQGHRFLMLPSDEETLLESIPENSNVLLAGFNHHLRSIAHKAETVNLFQVGLPLPETVALSGDNILRGPLCAPVIHGPEAEKRLEKADVVVIDASIMVFGKLEELLSRIPDKSTTILYGATAAIFPPSLFRRGIDAVFTWKVTNSYRMMNLLLNSGAEVEYHLSEAARSVIVKPAQ